MSVYFPLYLILILANFYLLVRAIREWQVEKILLKYGITSEARLVNCKSKANRRGSYYYYITFRIDLDSQHYEIEQMVSKKFYLHVYTGALVNVLYLPKNPRVIRLASDYSDKTQRNTFTFGAIFVTVI